MSEHQATFLCFGAECSVIVADSARPADARAAVGLAMERLLRWHERFSRFEPGSELSRLNRDGRETVPISPLLARILAAGVEAAHRTDGLVDITLHDQLVAAGYVADLPTPAESAAGCHVERPALPNPAARWRLIEVDHGAGTVTRPPGLGLDVNGIAKGVFADELGSLLDRFDAYVVDCAGDLRLGGTAAVKRTVNIARTTGSFELAAGGVATSGIERRSWIDASGRHAHHLLDPATGMPAFTGIVQVTALAPTAAEAEWRSKAALLSGPVLAARWLAHGGTVVLEDGSSRRYATPAPTRPTRAASHSHRSSSTRSCSGSLKISW
jgi:thiamine biosynthesis lipoprotein